MKPKPLLSKDFYPELIKSFILIPKQYEDASHKKMNQNIQLIIQE